jgi:iron only hydrogenase large subunit-like protein/uncharacterized Fe-S cluster-containing protein
MPEVLKLVKSNCRDCHKCIRFCPVKAIRFTGHQAHIINDECILCGSCYVVCPHKAKEIEDARETVKVMLQSMEPVVASLAPSFVAGFDGAGIGAMRDALKKLGFADAEETAIGATLVKREYEKQLNEGKRDIIITSCCPAVNTLIEKHYPELCRYISPVVTPMVAHAMDIKRRRPDVKVVFIGPCIAKKDEAYGTPVDAVLTFTELKKMFSDAGIEVAHETDADPQTRARLFPTVGGILRTMDLPDNGYTYITVDGARECRAALDDIAAGEIHRCFIEMSSCEGSCIGGPVMEKYDNFPIRHYQMAVKYAGPDDFNVAAAEDGVFYRQYARRDVVKPMPTEEQIKDILRSMGKNSPDDELNCGTCGYDSCRDKAVAVFRGIADPSMCLPFIMDRSERFSNNIFDNSPNGLIVVNDDFEIQQLNKQAMELLNIRSQSDVLGENVVRILDPTPFFQVFETGKKLTNQRKYYSDYKKYFEQTIVRDKASHMLICILRDVTEEEVARRNKEELGRKTAEIADNVVDKQMRIVQEIASLLGETAAETKVALTKLKESIDIDEDE